MSLKVQSRHICEVSYLEATEHTTQLLPASSWRAGPRKAHSYPSGVMTCIRRVPHTFMASWGSLPADARASK